MHESEQRQPNPIFARSKPSPKQRAFLDRNGLDQEQTMDAPTAHEVIGDFVHERRVLEPTAKQMELLKKHNLWCDSMSRGEAFDAISRILRTKANESRGQF